MSRRQNTRPHTVRFTHEEEQQLRAGVKRCGYTNASELIRQALWKELGAREEAASDAEQRMVAALERMNRDITRSLRGQQALFAVVDTLVRTILTCVPEPPQDALAQSVARGRDRYVRFIKSAGQSMVGDGRAAMKELVDSAD